MHSWRSCRVTAWSILNGQLYLATAFVETASGPVAGGACSDSEESASRRAQSEAIERASLITNGPGLVIDRAEALARGLPLLTPSDALSDATDWIPARRATTGECAGVPADVALLGRVSRQLGRLPWRQSSVGTAAHPDREAAAASGVLECLERRALRRVWAGLARLEPATEPLRALMPAGLVDAFERQRLVAHAWHVRDDTPAHVALALVGRKDRAQATFGAGAGFDDARVLLHALHEAVMVRAALSNRASQYERDFRRGVRSARHQEAFLAYLRELERPLPGAPDAPSSRAGAAAELPALVEERFGVSPLLIDIPSVGPGSVVKAVIPKAEFLIPRSDGEYVLAPGYLE